MSKSDDYSATSWNVRINTSRWPRPNDCPAWAKQMQREKWGEQGLILWDRGACQITKLSELTAL